jgi:hypothetical protein
VASNAPAKMPTRDSSEANWLEIFFMFLTNFQDSVELTP